MVDQLRKKIDTLMKGSVMSKENIRYLCDNTLKYLVEVEKKNVPTRHRYMLALMTGVH